MVQTECEQKISLGKRTSMTEQNSFWWILNNVGEQQMSM